MPEGMKNGVAYWGHPEGRNDETTTPNIRAGVNHYPTDTKEGTSMGEVDRPGERDSIDVPDETKKWGSKGKRPGEHSHEETMKNLHSNVHKDEESELSI